MKDAIRAPWTTPELTELRVSLATAAGGGSATDGYQNNPGNKSPA